MKDIANIFKLPPDELERKKANLWDDTAPEIVQFAKDLQEFIKKVDTPYVLGLDGGYGTGKTHFATRFCAQTHEEIMSLYFSAWEKDYYNNPLLSFVEMIAWLVKEESERFDMDCIKQAKATIQSLLNASDVILSLQLPFFSISYQTNVSRFLKNLKKQILPTDILQKAKYDLTEFIKRLPNHKLILIVDDMDRCRPDIAVKTLEVIKHFFDIEGLIVIIPVGKERLTKYINAFYGLPTDSREDKEEYLQKFLNETIQIPELNYLKICQDKITAKDFTQNLIYEGDHYNSITVLQKWMAHYAKLARLSYRETSEIINRAKIFCNNYKEPIRCRLLAYTLCNYIHIEKTKKFSSHPNLTFGDDNVYEDLSSNPRKKLLAQTPVKDAVARINAKYYYFIRHGKLDILYNEDKQDISTYQDKYANINFLRNEILHLDVDSICSDSRKAPEIKEILNNCLADLDNQNSELNRLQTIVGSDDDDYERKQNYINIVQNPHLIIQ